MEGGKAMLTRRQKHSLRGFTAVLSCCALLSAFLIYTNIANAEQPERVVFSEILEGAVAYSDSDDLPDVTLASEELMETMFSEKYATFTLRDEPPAGVTYISPSTLPYNDSSELIIVPDIIVTEASDAPDMIPANPNEITLLSDEIDALRTTASDTTTSVKTTQTTSSQTTSKPANTSVTTHDTTTQHTANSVLETTAPATSRTNYTTASSPAATTASATTARTTATAANSTAKTTSRAPITNVGGGTFSDDDTIYLTMLKLVNDARREAGVKELWYSARVHEVCRIRANELTSYYSHLRPDGSKFSTAFRDAGITYDKCGENIAYGRNMFETPEEVFKAWMESDSHRENILTADYDCMAFGLSVLKVGNDTYYYWAQEFAKF